MKIMMVCEFWAPQYDESVARAFEEYGNEVFRFPTYGYFSNRNFLRKTEKRLLNGPTYWKLWSDVIKKIKECNPDVIYFRLPLEYPGWLIRYIKKKFNLLLISYMNDDPFGLNAGSHRWKYFKKNIGSFDINCVFRKINIPEFSEYGAKKILLFHPYYVKEFHYSELDNFNPENYIYDVVFIGHYENDGRMDFISSLIKEKYRVGLFGNFLDYRYDADLYKDILPTKYLNNHEYRNIVEKSFISLCFFSKLNRDSLTTRVFEVPMCGGLLVCERNEEMEKLFTEDKEAVYFSSEEELLAKVKYLMRNKNIRDMIVRNARTKILKEGQEVKNRVEEILKNIH